MEILSESWELAGGFITLITGLATVICLAVVIIALTCLTFNRLQRLKIWLKIESHIGRIRTTAAIKISEAITSAKQTTLLLFFMASILIKQIIPKVKKLGLWILAGLGPWTIIYATFYSQSHNHQAIMTYSLGAIIASLVLCALGWPVLKIIFREKFKLAEVPIIMAIAILWVAPTIAVLPLLALSS